MAAPPAASNSSPLEIGGSFSADAIGGLGAPARPSPSSSSVDPIGGPSASARPKPLAVPADLQCSPSAAIVDELNKPALSHRKRKQEQAFAHMEIRRMTIADQASQAAETIGKLSAAAAEASSPPPPPQDPGPQFLTGQSVLHWWSSWMAQAAQPPARIRGKGRPAWFDATILASLGKMDIRYAGYDWKGVYAYQVH